MDLQSVRALAHRLYCQCNEPLSAFRPLSRCVRTLRNKLEDADEALSEATFRPEDVRVLEAAAESRDVLHGLERVLQQYRRSTPTGEDSDENLVVEFTTQILVVTRALQRALQDLERLNEDVDLILASARRGRPQNEPSYVQSNSTAPDAKTLSTASSSRSFSPSFSIRSGQRSSVSEAATTPLSMRWSDSMPDRFAVQSLSSSENLRSSIPSPRHAPYTLDPMSIGIEKASSMILSGQSSIRQTAGANTLRPSSSTVSATSADKFPIDSSSDHATDTMNRGPLSTAFHVGVWNKSDAGNLTGKRGRPQASTPMEMHTSPSLAVQPKCPVGYLKESDLGESAQIRAHWTRAAEGTEEHIGGDVGRHDVPAQSSTETLKMEESVPLDAKLVVSGSSEYQVVLPDHSQHSSHLLGLQVLSTVETAQAQEYGTATQRMLELPIMPPKPPRYRVVNQGHPPAPASHRSFDDDKAPAPPGSQLVNHRALPEESLVSTTSIKSTVPSPARSFVDGLLVDERSSHNSQRDDRDIPYTDKSLVEPSQEEQLVIIVRSWNASEWNQVDKDVRLVLADNVERNNTDMARRMLHLLGVISSLKGEWEQALTWFLSVLRSPMTSSSEVDAGDCAAAYWLGDTYSLLNRRAEALLAYSIAECGPLFQRPTVAGRQLLRYIRAEQQACQLGGSRSDLKIQWEREAHTVDRVAADSILNATVVDGKGAIFFIDRLSQQKLQEVEKPLILDPNQSRAMVFMSLGGEPGSWLGKHRLQLNQTMLKPSGPWPIAFDPCYAMASVARNRLLVHPCDLSQVFRSNPAASLPKIGLMDRSRKDCFTCQDLQWAIATLRSCLTRLRVEWCEMANVAGAYFVARYLHTTDEVATMHFFTISLFRLSLRPGYGIDVGSDGLSSARIMRSEAGFDKGVHRDETKRIRSLVRRYLDVAARRQEAVDLKNTALPVMSINGVTEMHRRTSVREKVPTRLPATSPLSSKAGSLFSRAS
ncbi:hypothetical protein LTR56_019516 [Elasticomyces elasticus]|nr:hypothetical protein LTR56_019516 [Elasticomyces elasticus]KAK3653726.1 hypothetical protein LTR22_011104 [Elasticomyces elasticus]KAK4924165.1 hypothetical protein LTR49_008685 [Elasticomyces elasticus]KAK5758513.1 hypothetical protein LTS12_011376 [Elasticomyces elasticus]